MVLAWVLSSRASYRKWVKCNSILKDKIEQRNALTVQAPDVLSLLKEFLPLSEILFSAEAVRRLVFRQCFFCC